MKPFFRKPRYELASPAAWTIFIGIVGTSVIPFTDLPQALVLLTLFYLVIGVMMWQEQRWATWIGFAIYTLFTVSRCLRLIGDFQFLSVGIAIFFAFTAYECWRSLQLMKEPPDDWLHSSADGFSRGEGQDGSEGDEDEGPMISFVLLQREPKYLEDTVLSRIVEAAWGGDYVKNEGKEDAESEYVIGENPLYFINSGANNYIVHNHDTPYWDDMDELVESINELRLRKAVANHTAWLSVDLIGASDEDSTTEELYRPILKLILELADENTLAIFRPETAEINAWSDDLAARLGEDDAHEQFARPDNVPVVPVSGDDPELIAAVETAKERWPEFVAAFENRGANEDEAFNAKVKLTVDDVTEFIWVDVIGLEPKYLHGLLANDPVDLGDLVLGSQVEVPIEEVQDWCYIKDGEPVGLFSVAAIQAAQERIRQQSESHSSE